MPWIHSTSPAIFQFRFPPEGLQGNHRDEVQRRAGILLFIQPEAGNILASCLTSDYCLSRAFRSRREQNNMSCWLIPNRCPRDAGFKIIFGWILICPEIPVSIWAVRILGAYKPFMFRTGMVQNKIHYYRDISFMGFIKKPSKSSSVP